MITIDTSALLAYFGVTDRNHARVTTVLDEDQGPYVLPVAVLAEMTFMIERKFRPEVEDAFLLDLAEGRYRLHWDERNLERIRVPTHRYADLPLGFADAAVVACAERHAGRIATIDRRHFDIVSAGERWLTVLP